MITNLLAPLIPFFIIALIISAITGIVDARRENKKKLKKNPAKTLRQRYGYDDDDEHDDDYPPYYARQLMTETEKALYNVLEEALTPDYYIMGQVQLSRVLGVKDGYNEYEWFNKISRMSVDFVIIDKKTDIVACIELDDRSHNQAARQVADAKKDRAIRAAGLKIIRWQVKNMPDAKRIRREVLDDF